VLARLGAEIFDLYAALAGLRYVRLNFHRGPVVLPGDGRSAIEFMRSERGLDLSASRIDANAMRDLIESLYPAFESVRWDWGNRSRNRPLGSFKRG
jgi:hypothetical protein